MDALHQLETKIPSIISIALHCLVPRSDETPETETKQCESAHKGTKTITGRKNLPALKVICATA
jgi:hypothetical protein